MKKPLSFLMSRCTRGKVWIVLTVLAFELLGSSRANATLIVGAPTVYPYGDKVWYEVNTGASEAVDFTLTGVYDISHIDVMFMSNGNDYQPFDWSLKDSLAGTSTGYASCSFTAGTSLTPTNETLVANTQLGAGTYYLVVSSTASTSSGFFGGWMQSGGFYISDGGTSENRLG